MLINISIKEQADGSFKGYCGCGWATYTTYIDDVCRNLLVHVDRIHYQ